MKPSRHGLVHQVEMGLFQAPRGKTSYRGIKQAKDMQRFGGDAVLDNAITSIPQSTQATYRGV